MLAVVQTAIHLCLDYDRVSLPVSKRKHEDVAQKQTPATSQKLPPIVKPMEELRSRIPTLLRAIGLRTTSIATVGPVIYALFIRKRAWDTTMFCTKLFSNVAPATELSYIPPYHISLIWRSMTSGFLLVFLWQSSNAVFSAFFTQEPLKRGQPLTAVSNVPNEALLDGLRSRIEVNRVSFTSVCVRGYTNVAIRHLPSGNFYTSVTISRVAEKPYSRRSVPRSSQLGHE